MISQIDKSGVNLELDSDLKKYIDKKVGRLDRFMPRQARKMVRASVKMRETSNQAGEKYVCEVILHLPGEAMTAKETTLNMFAAVDIVEAKLKNQLKKYKATHVQRAKEQHQGWFKRVFSR
ncbi:MAG: ribosome-associated translation inhibitor RaiA [Candidatus Woesebacteria bacterium]|jgi:putative sigma-54 modulation protein